MPRQQPVPPVICAMERQARDSSAHRTHGGIAVQFGSRVSIRRPDGSTRAYRIVRIDEADPKKRDVVLRLTPCPGIDGSGDLGDAVAVGAAQRKK